MLLKIEPSEIRSFFSNMFSISGGGGRTSPLGGAYANKLTGRMVFLDGCGPIEYNGLFAIGDIIKFEFYCLDITLQKQESGTAMSLINSGKWEKSQFYSPYCEVCRFVCDQGRIPSLEKLL